MMKILMATTAIAIMLGAAPGYAQTLPAPPATSVPPARSVQLPGQVDVQKLIGRNVTNPQNETIGEIESVMVDLDGKVRSVIIGVGGFLGMGERHVAVRWDSLTATPDGQKIVMTTTKEQLKSLAPYTYADATQRRSVFTERLANTGAPPLASGSSAMPATSFGTVSVSDLMGLNIRNAANETIGEIKDVVMSADGKVQEVIVGVGGFLGMGERYVSIGWNQLRIGRGSDNAFAAHISATAEQLKAMPAYKHEKSVWIRS